MFLSTPATRTIVVAMLRHEEDKDPAPLQFGGQLSSVIYVVEMHRTHRTSAIKPKSKFIMMPA